MTKTETLLMKIIWDNEGAIATQDLIQKLNTKFHKEYARTTVVTLVDRMKEKGYVEKYRIGNISYVRATISEHEYKIKMISNELEFWFDGDKDEMIRYINLYN